MHALSVTYRLNHATRAQHAELHSELAPAFAAVSGLVSQTCLANTDAGRYGAFYVFESKAAFDAFVASELFDATVGHPSVRDVAVGDFSVDLVTNGPRRDP
jgi:hypothetical protein